MRSQESGVRSQEPPPELSLVIPVYNEVENLRPLCDAIRKALDPLGRAYEVVFVDDGSTDGSGELLRDLRRGDARLRVLRFDRNHGQTAAFDAGFKAARGRVIVTLDADLQNDPGDIPLLLDRIGEYDAVCGWRRDRKDSWSKRIGSLIANTVRNRATGEEIHDTGCSLKAFRRECLEGLTLYKGMHRFLPTLVKMRGFRVVEVPVSHHPRRAGTSKYTNLGRIFGPLCDLWAVRWMQRRQLRYVVKEEK